MAGAPVPPPRKPHSGRFRAKFGERLFAVGVGMWAAGLMAAPVAGLLMVVAYQRSDPGLVRTTARPWFWVLLFCFLVGGLAALLGFAIRVLRRRRDAGVALPS